MAEQKKGELKYVPIEQIRGGHVSLRKVNTEDSDFIQLRDAIAQEQQILNPISVREVTDENGKPGYEIVDGLQRYTAAKQLNFKDVPCHVIQREDKDILFAQIIGNTARVEGKKAEYANALKEILNAEPTMTKSQLADRLARSPTWLDNMLSLTNLTANLQELVNASQIPLANAFQLAKLPQDEQENFAQRAMNDRPNEFGANVTERLKEIRSERLAGRTRSPEEFKPVAALRKTGEIKDIHNAYVERNDKSLGEAVVSGAAATNATEGFYAGIAWVLSMDPVSVQQQRTKYEDRIKAREEARNKRREEAQKAKEAKAAEIHAAMEETAAA